MRQRGLDQANTGRPADVSFQEVVSVKDAFQHSI